METVTIVLIEDHGMVRESLTAAINMKPFMDVTATATTLAKAVVACDSRHPHVAVCDYQLPDGLGQICQAYSPPSTRRCFW